MDMQSFIEGNYAVIIIILAALVYLGCIYNKLGRDKMIIQAKKMALELMLVAEKNLSTEEGQTRMKYVIENFYKTLPEPLKFLISEIDIEQFLQEVYNDAKKILE